MERRRDSRHELAYAVSLKCLESRRVIDGAWSETVSASGMLVRTEEPHTLRCGDRLEVRVYATIPGGTGGAFSDTMALATDAVVVRRSLDSAALRFDAPLAY
jgi:hypothetical protein